MTTSIHAQTYLQNRRITLESSEASAVTLHTFDFDIMSANSIGSIEFEYCSNTPFPGDACTLPSGFDASSTNLINQIGETGFAIHPSSTSNRIVISRVPAVPVPGSVQYIFDNITNPDSPASYYVRLSTFGSTDGTGPRIDEGGLAFRIIDNVDISAYVPPILEFCTGNIITGTDCTTAAGSNIDFGELSTTQTRYGSTQMVAGTNAFGGYTISSLGTTMTSGNNVITAIASTTTSNPGTQQFGLNLVANAVPPIGADPTGVGTGSPTADYSTTNNYKFVPGDVLASSLLSSEFNKYTVSYIVNIDNAQKPGVYTTTITYLCLATF